MKGSIMNSPDFRIFKTAMQQQLKKMTQDNKRLFITIEDKYFLWETYLNSFPEGTNPIYKVRKEYDCSCCKSFIRNIGNVVSLNEKLELESIWDIETSEEVFNIVAKKMSDLVKSHPIKEVYYSYFSKIGTNNNKSLIDGRVKTFEHFYLELPLKYVVNASSKSIESLQGQVRASKNVFKRSLDELTLDAAETILELIDQNSLYRGEEFKPSIKSFIEFKKKYSKIEDEKKNNWCWINSEDNPVSRIRNTAIGTLLIDLSENVDLDEAVRKFEAVVAPTNYNRPKAIISKKMIENAENKIKELDLVNSLGRRHAISEDVSVNNVLFVNRDTKKKMKDVSIFDDLKEIIGEKPKNFSKTEEIEIEEFIKNVLPKTEEIELLVENKHKVNLVSLISPKDKDSKSMFKWNNNFSWDYYGNFADSMKERVKQAGGKVDGVLRFSIQWNDDKGSHNSDLDAHAIEPDKNEISFMNCRKPSESKMCGQLDVDIINPGNKIAIENITYNNVIKMKNGKYKFFVNCFNKRGNGGFEAEIEYKGKIYHYIYENDIKHKENVVVAEIDFDKDSDELKFISSLKSTESCQDVWGINTNKFEKVSMMMYSPNYWDAQKSIGNKHYFFIMNNCKNPDNPRGFFNEFLKGELLEHKKVFEALGSKMKVEYSGDQLSGIGFSSTQRNSIIAKVKSNNFKRVLKINF